MRLPALAQTAYPSRTIKTIVPYPAGGTTDFLGRLVADQLKSGLGATVIVENKPGASTALGAEQVARAEPDGYTLLMATATTLAVNKALQKAAIRSGEGFYAGRAGGRGARHSDAGRRRPYRF
jgi:tripartite-type tricarboxylate transporter receptor subunit TctC